MRSPLSWNELESLADFYIDPQNGPTNSQSRLRLFGQAEEQVRVTLYRDHHAWCPYCQKVWLWLEEKQIPYRIEKVTMFCYGQKEDWYKEIVPWGTLPALKLDDRIITESDDILLALEQAFGSLYKNIMDPDVLSLRKLERQLFGAWCRWLCSRSLFPQQEQQNRQKFLEVVDMVENALSRTFGPYFLEQFSTVDVIFIPYLERMNASLYYYKGYSLREANPLLGQWFDAIETKATYRGTQSDFSTHAHDLPPQMGGCWSNTESQTLLNQARVDEGPWFGLPDVGYSEPKNSKVEALYRVIRHRTNIIKVNPAPDILFEESLRCALTHLITGESVRSLEGSVMGLRYLRDRISVPRDMSIYAAKRLRDSLEAIASIDGTRCGTSILAKHRMDQNPANFASKSS